jgi:hypothetical protein
VWDPECRYHYANGVMRAGMLVVGFQLADIAEGWGGFGVIPGSHKLNYPLPNAVRLASTKGVVPRAGICWLRGPTGPLGTPSRTPYWALSR